MFVAFSPGVRPDLNIFSWQEFRSSYVAYVLLKSHRRFMAWSGRTRSSPHCRENAAAVRKEEVTRRVFGFNGVTEPTFPPGDAR